MQCLYNASQLLMVLNSQSECRQRCIATAFLKEKITEVFILKLLLIISDLMWQVMRSCFRFDRNTKRVTWLFYYASICLFEQNNTTNHTASIAPASPQDGVITYTTVCSSRQAASNPIGLNLHLQNPLSSLNIMQQEQRLGAMNFRHFKDWSVLQLL